MIQNLIKHRFIQSILGLACIISAFNVNVASAKNSYVFEAGHPSLQEWLLPETPPFPPENEPTAARIALGKALFFDPRLSGSGNMSCATCHSPMFGWSDGLKTARGAQSAVLERASPTVVNTAYNFLQMWDGRKPTLEAQALGPLETTAEMHSNFDQMLTLLNEKAGYIKMFNAAYPKEPIDKTTLAKAIASYERTIISRDSRFDQWVRGDKSALSKQEVLGFEIFASSEKGNCAVCHSAPNFNDNGFHNIGLASFASKKSDVGRFSQRPLGLMKGAFKTPTIRDIELTAPYFHDGSAENLLTVVEHYARGGDTQINLSPNMKKLSLSKKDKEALVAFMKSLTTKPQPVTFPELPL
ncbi:MAG: cytochrome c peroxidase [Pseudomonadota bacterium]